MLTKQDIEEILNKDISKLLKGGLVYKFASFEVAMDKIISNKSLKFTNPTTFNDPFDCNEYTLVLK